MKQSSNKIVRNTIYILALISVIVFFIYGIIYKFPSIFKETVTKIEKDVNITDEGIADAVEKVYDSIVEISSTTDDSVLPITGFIYKKTADCTYIVSNYNNTLNDSNYNITLSDGKNYSAEIVSKDKFWNIAIFKISAIDLKIAEISDNSNLRIGDTVFSIYSNVDNEYNWNISRGVISGNNYIAKVNNFEQVLLQTDMSTNLYNDSGILCNSNGDVVGLSISINNNLYGISIVNIIDAIEQKINSEKIKLNSGLSLIDLDKLIYNKDYKKIINDLKIEKGIYVLDVNEDMKNYFQKGDVIFKINNKKIESRIDFKEELSKYQKGDKVNITFYREEVAKTISIEL